MANSNLEILASEDSPLGLLCLRRRELLSRPGTIVTEVTLNHEFLMSSLYVDSEQALSAIRSSRLADGSRFDPMTTALVEAPMALGVPGCGSRCGSVAWESISETRIALRVHAQGDVLLVLSDVYYPGWTAQVGGESAPLHRVNYLLRGVRLPPGEHQVEFAFASRSFALGAGISGASILLLLVLFGYGSQHSRTESP